MRDTARAPQPPTDSPTGHIIDQKCQFWAKFGRFGAKNPFFTGEIKSFVIHITENPPRNLVHIVFGQALDKCAKNGNIWPKMTKNADFGPILAGFGPKILIFMGVSKSFGTNITENHLDNLSGLFFTPCPQKIGFWAQKRPNSVSYTHLTLPTKA